MPAGEEDTHSNSLHYLLSLWQRLVAGIPYVRTAEPYLVDEWAPRVAEAFVRSRLDAVPRFADAAAPNQAIPSSAANAQRQGKGKANTTGADSNGTGNTVSASGDHHGATDDDGLLDGLSPLDDSMTLTQQLEQVSADWLIWFGTSVAGTMFSAKRSN